MATAMFDAYGTRASTDGSTDPYSGYGAQYGYYTDAETGLQLLGQRYYNPAAGRFVTRDPIGYAGGTNLYSYCGNNPVSGADPSGTSDFFTGMFVGYMHFCLGFGNLGGNKDYDRAVDMMFPTDPCDGFNYNAHFTKNRASVNIPISYRNSMLPLDCDTNSGRSLAECGSAAFG